MGDQLLSMRPDRIERKYIGTRVGFTLAACGCYFGTLFCLATYPGLSQPEAWSALGWVIGAIAVAIAGDTARPSGLKSAAFGSSRVEESPAE